MANRNPNQATRFQKGQSGNPGGVPKERKKLLMEAADMAAQVQHRMLEATLAMLRENPEKERALEFLTPDTRQLMKELLDRAEGTAKQSVDHTSSDGSLGPSRIVIEAARDNSNG